MKQHQTELFKKINQEKLTNLFPAGSFTRIHSSAFRYFIICLIMIGSAAVTQAQDKPQPVNATLTDSAITIEDRLVELALKGPLMLGTENQNRINQYALVSAKNAWMNLLSFSINYNEQSFAKNTNTNNTYIYPKYFFGFTIPMGTIFSKTPIKSAREQIEYSKHNQEQLARTIKAEVLTRYKQYINFGELIKLQNEVVVNEQAAVNQIESKMNEESFSIDVYKLSLKTLNNEKANMLNLLLQRDVVKIEIEKIIGTSLDSVLIQ